MNQGPISKANKARNTHKAIENLWGLCFGLTADKKLNSLEIQFLEIWLADNQHLHDDPDAYDLYEAARDIIRQGQLTSELSADLHQLINQITEYRSHRADNDATRQINLLLGYIQGILADEVVNNDEIKQLNSWMNENEEWRTTWPGNAINNRLKEILEDGIISSSERADLTNMLNKVNNSDLIDTGSAQALTITLGADEIDDLTFNNSGFCFTGTFMFGPRSSCISAIESLGGINHKTLTKKTDYLVLGTNVSRDWINTSFGRKIEKAKAYQAKGANTKIITEEAWISFLS